MFQWLSPPTHMLQCQPNQRSWFGCLIKSFRFDHLETVNVLLLRPGIIVACHISIIYRFTELNANPANQGK